MQEGEEEWIYILEGKSEEKILLGRPRCWWKVILKWILEK
jgi:hypothetical protein